MGITQHDAIIVTGVGVEFDSGYTVSDLREIAVNLFQKLDIGPIQKGAANGWVHFFIPPDGSKEGWYISHTHDHLREEFLRQAKEYPVGIVIVSYGEIRNGVTVMYGGETSFTRPRNPEDM